MNSRCMFDGRLWVHYSQAYVFSGNEWGEWDGDMAACFRGQANGLLGAARPGLLFLVTGLHTGEVGFRVEVHSAAAPADDGWEECVEASFSPRGASAKVIDWNGGTCCDLRLPASDYRVRYCARGMDAGRTADTLLAGQEPVDTYLLAIWPEAGSRDRVVKQTSETAAYWHDAAPRM